MSDRGPDHRNAPDPRAEQVVAQALNLMAGGGRTAADRAGGTAGGPGQAGTGSTSSGHRLSPGQLLLLAALMGLVLGIGAGFLSLVL